MYVQGLTISKNKALKQLKKLITVAISATSIETKNFIEPIKMLIP